MEEQVKPKTVQKFKNWTMLSSQVKSTSYNEETKEMIVEFNAGKYAYADVPLDVWKLSLVTTSIGKFINTSIKPKYEVKKLN